MMILLGGLAAIILAGLSGIHFYWALGGKWGFEEALPTNLEGNTVLKPNTFSCFYVGASLLLLALFYGIRIGLFPISLPSWLVQYAGWLIPTLFLLRTLGDFRYVGVFKKIKTTGFAERDTKYFVPICAFLCIAGYWVQYILS